METVPVRGMPSDRTCIGTVRVLSILFRLDSLIMEDRLYEVSFIAAQGSDLSMCPGSGA